MNAIDVQPVFSLNSLDRMDHLRDGIEAARLTGKNRHSDQYLLLCQGNVLVSKTHQACFFSANELKDTLLNDTLCVFLGGKDQSHYFSLAVPADLAEAYDLVPLRTFVVDKMLVDKDLGMLAEANSLLCWHQSHAFCACCGTQSVVAHGGWRRDCPSCATEHFPRIDPVVIMLVTYGDKCLLGRGHQFPERVFSCLAGFMEPGETIEQAALRELWEEAGVKGIKADYLLDQPWPFPSNLMIGVHIEAQDDSLNIDHNELDEAIWVTKSEVKEVLSGDNDQHFLLPPRLAIARNLLEHWVDA
ncbi:NAD(+) diphosphatase [Shewanella sp.]|uniref:NAD(+) diphosphatase n=1 Tax=Shewanella sp. TaxID=50422 RepID=UPI001EB53A98|nr:NAD(+) diphosphatase [Shewanella sp.]NRB24999.1 NAD(+) diphosphatase [Shewanella sp.]